MGNIGRAVRALVLGAVLAVVGATGAQAGLIKVEFSFSAEDNDSSVPFDVSGAFTYDDALTGIINGNQFVSESLTIEQGGTGLPTIENYLARFRWDIDNQAIRMPDDTINSSLTSVGGSGDYFLNYDDVVGLTVFAFLGAAFPQTIGITIPQDGLALGAPFSYTVTAVPEPGSLALMAIGLVALAVFARRTPSISHARAALAGARTA